MTTLQRYMKQIAKLLLQKFEILSFAMLIGWALENNIDKNFLNYFT
jgi:hypothetical protein